MGRPGRLDDLFAAFDAAGLRWSLLRPTASLAQPEGDIDVLVEPTARRVAADVLAAQRFVPLPLPGRDVHAVDYDVASDRFLWVHVQGDLRVGGAVIAAGDVLGHVERDPLPRPDDAWMFWILVLHGTIDKREIAPRHRASLTTLAGAADDPTTLTSVAVANGLEPSRVRSLVEAGDWDGLAALPTARPTPPPPLRSRLGERRDRWRRLWTWRGLSIAVIGPDGAGKTTLVDELRATLPFPTRVVYGGLTGGRLVQADRLRVPGLVFGARVVVLWARWARAWSHQLRGEIVVFDRHPLDASVPSGFRLGRVARLSRRLQGELCPRPGLVLLLDAAGTTMHARSQEYDAETLEAWRAAYARLRSRVRNVELIDAEQPADVVRRQAKSLIWLRYADRWRPRHGADAVSSKT